MSVGLPKIPVPHLRAMWSMVTLELCDAGLVVPRHCICGLQTTHLYFCWTISDTCTTSPSNAFYGDLGALSCLSSGPETLHLGLKMTHWYVCWTVSDTCTTSPSNAFYGDLGALRCLSTGFGDIAFVDYSRLTSTYLII